MTPRLQRSHTIVLASGKGGCGKTSVALSMAKCLAQLDIKTALVDADMVTHGATYFFSSNDFLVAGDLQSGLHDFLTVNLPELPEEAVCDFRFDADRLPQILRDCGDHPCVSSIQERLLSSQVFHATQFTNLCFVPSKVDFKKLDWDLVLSRRYETLLFILLRSVVVSLQQQGYEAIVIDTQAGPTVTTLAAAALSSDLILVAESDAVSVGATRNLERQLNSCLPQRTYFLLNKVAAPDADRAQSAHRIFDWFSHLPMIPFSQEIRDSFSTRRIPYDLEEYSSWGIAINSIVERVLPELKTALDEIVGPAKQRAEAQRRQKDRESRTLTDEREVMAKRLKDIERAYMSSERARLTAETTRDRERFLLQMVRDQATAALEYLDGSIFAAEHIGGRSRGLLGVALSSMLGVIVLALALAIGGLRLTLIQSAVCFSVLSVTGIGASVLLGRDYESAARRGEWFVRRFMNLAGTLRDSVSRVEQEGGERVSDGERRGPHYLAGDG